MQLKPLVFAAVRALLAALGVVVSVVLIQILYDLYYQWMLQRDFSMSTVTPLQYPLRKSSERLHFFTYATHFKWPVCILAQSIHHFSSGKLHLNVLGQSTYSHSKCAPVNKGRWRITGLQQLPFVKYEKNYCKLVWMDWAVNHLATQLGIQDSDVLIFTDGYDAMVQRNVFDILPTFRAMEARYGQSVFIGGDGLCWPFCCGYYLRDVGAPGRNWSTNPAVCQQLAALSKAVDPRGSYYHFPNSGTYIGRLAALRKFFYVARVRHSRQRDDQAIVALTMLEFPQLVGLDRRAELFHSLYQTDENNGTEAHTVVAPPYTPYPTLFNVSRFYPQYSGKTINSFCQPGYFDQMRLTLATPQKRRRKLASQVPKMLKSGNAPFIFHFNGLSRKYMTGCVLSFLMTFPWNSSIPVYDVDRNTFRTVGDICSNPFQ